jgi:hypothetical protein
MQDQAAIIAGYFRNWRERDDRSFWAWEAVNDLVAADPDAGLAMVLELIRHAPNDRALGYVAAGPLEDLLGRHGQTVIAAVEEAARREPRVRSALCGVWPGRIDPAVWERVADAAMPGRRLARATLPARPARPRRKR